MIMRSAVSTVASALFTCLPAESRTTAELNLGSSFSLKRSMTSVGAACMVPPAAGVARTRCACANAAAAALDDEALERLGHRDRYERNPDGSLIPLTVRRKPSDQLVLKMLAAHFPRAYGDKLEHQ